MKLRQIDFCLDWPDSIEVIDLRKYVMDKLMENGDVIRWSIVDIQNSGDAYNTKRLTIFAVLADYKN